MGDLRIELQAPVLKHCSRREKQTTIVAIGASRGLVMTILFESISRIKENETLTNALLFQLRHKFIAVCHYIKK